MKRAIINPDLCKNCPECLIETNCTQHAIIREDPSEKPWIDLYQCNGCMKCKNYCKYNAAQEIYHPCSGNAKQGW